ncbi:MAG: hypothetical protein KGL35_32935 [Bradyrhizobium sp.]|nr:hypothetical protein [Bradyrhizobium sp.]
MMVTEKQIREAEAAYQAAKAVLEVERDNRRHLFRQALVEGWTQVRIAKVIGWSQSSVSQVIRRER